MTYNYNLDSPFQTLWMEIQFAKKQMLLMLWNHVSTI